MFCLLGWINSITQITMADVGAVPFGAGVRDCGWDNFVERARSFSLTCPIFPTSFLSFTLEERS